MLGVLAISYCGTCIGWPIIVCCKIGIIVPLLPIHVAIVATGVETRSGHLSHITGPGQSRSTQFIKYPGLTRFCNGSCVLIMASGPDQSNELSMLHSDDDDDGRICHDSPQNTSKN